MSEEKKGFLQTLFGKREAKEGNEEQPSGQTESGPVHVKEILEITPAIIDNARLALLDILKSMQLEVDVVSKPDTMNGIELEITGNEDLGLVIGKEGNTLNSLQYLLSLMLSKKYQKKVYVHIDANAYKEKKKSAIIASAEDAANVAEAEKVQIALDPMTAAERRMVHLTLQAREGVETYSRGEGNLRHVVIAPKKQAE